MIRFQQEKWADCVAEMRLLWPEHWAELALNRDEIVLDCDEAKYEQGEAMGCLHIVTARDGEKLVGYHYGMLMTHLHYKSSGLMCYTDVYFLKPEYRRGSSGILFLLAVMRSLKSIGVIKFYMSTKEHQNHGELFAMLGGTLSDHVWTWML